MYTVQVNDPPAIYKPRHFPRKFKYKKDAIAAANAAVMAGASMARVEFPNGAELDFRPPPNARVLAAIDALPDAERQAVRKKLEELLASK